MAVHFRSKVKNHAWILIHSGKYEHFIRYCLTYNFDRSFHYIVAWHLAMYCEYKSLYCICNSFKFDNNENVSIAMKLDGSHMYKFIKDFDVEFNNRALKKICNRDYYSDYIANIARTNNQLREFMVKKSIRQCNGSLARHIIDNGLDAGVSIDKPVYSKCTNHTNCHCISNDRYEFVMKYFSHLITSTDK